MDSAPSKRRKTSHTTSAPVDAPTTPSPVRPRREAAKARTTPRRASFLSPTKASIARFNPELITRPQSPSSSDRRSKRHSILGPPSPTRRPLSPPKSSVTGGSHAEASTAHESTTSSVAESDATRVAPLQEATPAPSVDVALRPPTLNGPEAEGLRASPRRRLQGARKPASASKGSQGAKNLGVLQGEVQATDVRAKNAPHPTRRSARLSGGSTGQDAPIEDAVMLADDGEPDLPPIPAPLGEAVTAINKGPVGLLSSPSRRPKRARLQKATPSSAATEVVPSAPRRGADLNAANANKDTAQHGKDVHIVVDESAARRETREQLMSQLQALQEEVEDLERQVAAATAAAEATATAAANPSPPEASPLDIAGTSQVSLEAFLPFSRRRRRRLPIGHKTASSLPVRDDPPPSHHPIELDDPLPYLRIFTPLTFTSSTRDVLRPAVAAAATASATDEVAYEEHTITARSAQHLLTAVMTMTVEPSSHRITALEVSALSYWAEAELGRWMRARAASDDAAGKDVSSICWAAGRYYLLAKKRAHFWARCERDFADLLDISSSSSSSSAPNATTGSASARNAKGRAAGGDVADGGRRRPSGAAARATANTTDRRDLARHLGRSSLVFQRGPVQLLMSWSVAFDWTGEAHSRVSAMAAVPGTWTRADSRSSLAKVPALFQTLLKDKGVLVATKVLVRLLFPDS